MSKAHCGGQGQKQGDQLGGNCNNPKRDERRVGGAGAMVRSGQVPGVCGQ